MLKKYYLLLSYVALSVVSGCAEENGVPHAGEAPDSNVLVPFETYFAPASYLAPKVSPDGTMISYIAPNDGVRDLYVAPVDNMSAARPMINNKQQAIQASDVSGQVMYQWSADSKYIIYPQDYAGDENWDLWAVDVAAATARNLTPDPRAKYEIAQMSTGEPSIIAVTKSAPGSPFPDLYSLNIETAELQLQVKNPGLVLSYVVDNAGDVPAVLSFSTKGGFDLLIKEDESAWTSVLHVDMADKDALALTGFQKIGRVAKNNRFSYAYFSGDRNTAALYQTDLKSGARTLVAADERGDLAGVLYDTVTNSPIAFATNWERLSWHALDDEVDEDLSFLKDHSPKGDFKVVSQSADNQIWIVSYQYSDFPVVHYAYDRSTKIINRLFSETPQLEQLVLSKMVPFEMTSDDGFSYVSYYSLPIGSDANSDGIPDKPQPTVMLVHGGPSDERATYGFGAFVQWLNNRGYAVLNVNFRGSPGFGKAFLNAQNMEWGGLMHQDLLDQVDWAVEQGIADPSKVALLGGSYGGYATLVGMTMTPDIFACGIDLVGPSNLEIFMPHWNVDMMAHVVGDPRTEEGRAHLRSRSPVNFAHQTKNPVLIGQGANDSRVPQSQSDQMVAKMEQAGAEVTYIVYPDEGHGFRKPENNASFWGVAEVFLSNCLGGRTEAIGSKLKGSTIQVRAGVDHIPGLADLIAAAGNDD